VSAQSNVSVAVLLATYNGAQFIEPQISSLSNNTTSFTLHWIDDHSTDNTREAVRAAALKSGIALREWRQEKHQGYPGVFFQLMECVEADIYLFCDQDDIWQPGKIDATVQNLVVDISSPVLCFSDALVFNDHAPEVVRRLSDVIDIKAPAVMQDSRLFMAIPAAGHTMGFTRPLRDIFLRHSDVARRYAFAHDWWMYLLAVASGSRRMMSNVPTTLYRRHAGNFSAFIFDAGGISVSRLFTVQQLLRPGAARQAEGFILAAKTLTPGPHLQSLVALAGLIAKIDRRQSLATMIHLARSRALWPATRTAIFFAAACLFSSARYSLSASQSLAIPGSS